MKQAPLQTYRVTTNARRAKHPELGTFTVTADVEAPNRAVAERLGRAKAWSEGIILGPKTTVTMLD